MHDTYIATQHTAQVRSGQASPVIQRPGQQISNSHACTLRPPHKTADQGLPHYNSTPLPVHYATL